MMQSPAATVLDRIPTKRLQNFEWSRAWRSKSALPDSFLGWLKKARSFAGFGIDDPFEIFLGSQSVSVRSAISGGQPLTAHLNSSLLPRSEEWARSFLEQLCQILIRIHSRDTVHGALNPFNIRWQKGFLSVWSVPTASLELQYGEMAPWERLYCSPAVRSGAAPSRQDDFFSLGKLFERIVGMEPGEDFPTDLSESGRLLITRCRDCCSGSVYQSAEELLKAIDPKSSLLRLDLRASAEFKRMGMDLFLQGRPDAALDAWSESFKYDWLEVGSRNNLAVLSMSQGLWEEALDRLEEARKIFEYHPVVDMNLGYCHWQLKNIENADFRLNRAADLNPWLPQPRLILAQMALELGRLEVAMKHALNFCAIAPKSKPGRLLLASLLDRIGDSTEARLQKNIAADLAEEPEFRRHLIGPGDPPSWGMIRTSTAPNPDRGIAVQKRLHPRAGREERRPER